MVRPYLPRFLREGDRAELKVVVNNASEKRADGASLAFEILDPETNAEPLGRLRPRPRPTRAARSRCRPAAARTVTFPLTAPARVGTVAFKVTATAGEPLRRRAAAAAAPPGPDAPGAVALRHAARRTSGGSMRFDDLAQERRPDAGQRADGRHRRRAALLRGPRGAAVPRQLPLRVHRADAQPLRLDRHRLVALRAATRRWRRWRRSSRSARRRSRRGTRADPNRKMALEETPWLVEAQGGKDAGDGLANVLDPRIAKARARGGARQAPEGADRRSAASPGGRAGRRRPT